MMFKSKTLMQGFLATVLSISSVAALATPVTINFDNMASNVAVGATYSSLGVTFKNAQTVSISVAGGSAPNAINSMSTSFQPQPSDPLSAIFSFAVSSVQLTGLDIGLNGFMLTAYDAAVGGKVVDTKQIIGPDFGVGSFYTLAVSGANIYRVDFSQVRNVTGDGAAFDNLVFNKAEVPEPATLGMLGLGLGALAVVRRKRKS